MDTDRYRDKPTNVRCSRCDWRGKRVCIFWKDIDYDEYTPPYGKCPKCKAMVYPSVQVTEWRRREKLIAAGKVAP